MLKAIPIKAFNDNYIWLIHSKNNVLCIDPGDAQPVLTYLHERQLILQQIWITHHHHDHVDGVAALKQAYPNCVVFGNKDVSMVDVVVEEGSRIPFAHTEAKVWATPGHTDQHLSYLFPAEFALWVFCGDTLFSAGCGRVFTGTVSQLFHSFQRYKTLPTHTLFYPAHEYTAANLRFALHIESDNAEIAMALKSATRIPTLPVTLAHECQVNPFLRTAYPEVAQRVSALSGNILVQEEQVFAALRALKNYFR